VRTPGLPPSKILEKNPGIEAKITSQVSEFLKAAPTKNIIGVTGTKGKGTTSTLVAKMLAAAGYDVQLGGNIGISPLTFLNKLSVDSWVVLELSSFQLIDIQQSPHISVCLMVVPEHQDWHKSVEEYYEAKSNIFAHQTPEDIAIYFADSDKSRQLASKSPGQKIPYYAEPGAHVDGDKIVIDGKVICQTSELRLLGKHNWQNVCAAITAVWQATQDVAALRSVLTSFTGLPHHIELVRDFNGVQYYDDSFGTTPETAIVAVEAFEQPEIVIVGGHGKGIPFDNLARVIASRPNVKHVITIGTSGLEIKEELEKAGYHNVVDGAPTIDEIVRQAQELAEPGSVVLLSPACASFDMFKNYKDRGERFTQAVQSLV
jgi:UDP-N-acetylmuramoylalanine--D-glutamate ligase